MHHSSIREVDLLSFGERQECRAGPKPMATRVGVACSPGKGCVGPENTTAQYVADRETTVRTYLYILYISPAWVLLSVLHPLHQKG